MNARELVEFLSNTPFCEEASVITPWITGSRPFFAFAEEHRSKIRKKLRTAGTRENLRSVLLELEVAYDLLSDHRCQVEYERYGSERGRTPDLTLTFRTRTVIHIEVTQVQAACADAPARESKLMSMVCQKLGQMMPESPNVLMVAPTTGAISAEDMAAAMKRLQHRVEQRDAELLSRFGFVNPSGFYKQFRWLSGILVRNGQGDGVEKELWPNPQTRRPLPSEVASLLSASPLIR